MTKLTLIQQSSGFFCCWKYRRIWVTSQYYVPIVVVDRSTWLAEIINNTGLLQIGTIIPITYKWFIRTKRMHFGPQFDSKYDIITYRLYSNYLNILSKRIVDDVKLFFKLGRYSTLLTFFYNHIFLFRYLTY